MKKLSTLIIAVLSCFCFSLVNAQNITVRGTVTDEKGETLPAVSVLVKGGTTGTQTDVSGNFVISAPPNGTLVFTYIGFQTQEIPINNQTSLKVQLQSTSQQLEQVVVVGYGVQRKSDVTGSVAKVEGGELAKQQVLTPTQAVQGKVAGVQVISSGDPNANPTVRIRGVGTMLGGANPLYVVDGVITDDIRNINNADIVSMDILKDASATAIYGMRAANGVILITTKKGQAGKMVIAYDGNFGVREVSHLVDMAGAQQYAGYLNEANIYYGSGDPLITEAQLAAGANTDWYDAILKNGFQQNQNISVSGGGDKGTYFISAGLITDAGIVRTNHFNRFTIRSNNDYNLAKWLKLSNLISFSRGQGRNIDFGVFNSAYRAAPYVPATRDGKYGNTSLSNNVSNPLVTLDKLNDGIRGNRFQGTFAADIKPLEWLSLRSSFGVDLNFFKSTAYSYQFDNAGDNGIFITPGGNQLRNNSGLTINDFENTKWVWDNTATITKKYDLHNITFLAGVTSEYYRQNVLTGFRQNVPEDRDQWYLEAGTPAGSTNNNTGDKWSRSSFISRLNYSYDNRYLLTATFRADGTSRFPSQNRWGYFPSIGLGWNIINEDFMDDQKLFSALKLRGSWGRVGNDQIPTDVYFPIAAINIPYIFAGSEIQGIRFDQLPDRNVKWETTEEIDIGLDYGFLNGKLTGEIDYYNKKTKNALTTITIPGILGDINNEFITNAATFRNSGFEFSANWNQQVNEELDYTIYGNFSTNKNKIENLNGGQPLNRGNPGGNQGFTTRSDNGQPIASFYLLQVDGVFQNEAEIAGSAQPNAIPGDLRYRDISGDGAITDADRAFSGAYIPKITYGFGGTVNYKNFDFSLSTYGTGGGKIYNGKKAGRFEAGDNLVADVVNNRWTPNNPSNSEPRASLTQLPASTYFLENGSFFRINNLTLGYSLPKDLISKYKMERVRIYFSAQNLATITGYSGFTPEFQSTDVLAAGVELGVYPTTRTYSFGVSVGF